MLTVSLEHYIALSACLFGIGMLGALLRRNALVLLMSIELMLNAANLVFLAYAKHYHAENGQVIAFLVMAIAAAEAAVGLAIVLGVFRTRERIDVNELDSLRDRDIDAAL